MGKVRNVGRIAKFPFFIAKLICPKLKNPQPSNEKKTSSDSSPPDEKNNYSDKLTFAMDEPHAKEAKRIVFWLRKSGTEEPYIEPVDDNNDFDIFVSRFGDICYKWSIDYLYPHSALCPCQFMNFSFS
jgi:hypothetical protein